MADARLLRRLVEALHADIAVLFCKFRGFTTIASQLDPPTVAGCSTTSTTTPSTSSTGGGGSVMQSVDAEVFAVFGTRLLDDDRCSRVLAAARDMVDRVDELDSRLAEDRTPAELFGIGVNDGPAVTAHVELELCLVR